MEPTPSPRGSHEGYGKVPRSCSSTSAAMWYGTQAAGRLTTHLGI